MRNPREYKNLEPLGGQKKPLYVSGRIGLTCYKMGIKTEEAQKQFQSQLKSVK